MWMQLRFFYDLSQDSFLKRDYDPHSGLSLKVIVDLLSELLHVKKCRHAKVRKLFRMFYPLLTIHISFNGSFEWKYFNECTTTTLLHQFSFSSKTLHQGRRSVLGRGGGGVLKKCAKLFGITLTFQKDKILYIS